MRQLVTLALLSGCLVGGGTRTVSALELRASVAGYSLDRVDPALRNALASGAIWAGASETELYLSRGQPHLWWNTQINGSACRIFVHHGADPANADVAVTTCNGRVVGTNAIEPALPCWRLGEVGPRIAAATEYFESRPLDTQWQIVIGLLHRGQSDRDVKIAFGDPYSSGFDEREDGKRAEKIVFLDRSGDAYGLAVTFIQDAVVSWQMPANRVLTPEAQQRRLDAMEKRLNDRIAQLEATQARQHAETVKMFNQVMSRQDEMMQRLIAPPTPPRELVAAASGRQQVVIRNSTHSTRSEHVVTESSRSDRAPTNESQAYKDAILDPDKGTCRCEGWGLGTDKKTADKPHESYTMLGQYKSDTAEACMSYCLAGNYGGGKIRFPDRCD